MHRARETHNLLPKVYASSAAGPFVSNNISTASSMSKSLPDKLPDTRYGGKRVDNEDNLTILSGSPYYQGNKKKQQNDILDSLFAARARVQRRHSLFVAKQPIETVTQKHVDCLLDEMTTTKRDKKTDSSLKRSKEIALNVKASVYFQQVLTELVRPAVVDE